MSVSVPESNGVSLLVASTGGHLEQLHRIYGRLRPAVGDRVEWVTFDTDQSRSLLASERVHYVPYIAPRDYSSVMANIPIARRILKNMYSRVVTTGAGIALPFVSIARSRRIPCHYIESAARGSGPSVTGGLLARLPGVRLYSQYDSWANRRWRFRGSVFDGFSGFEQAEPPPVRRVVVTLGTMRNYHFTRAVESLAGVLPAVVEPGAEILWQTGPTDASGLGISGRNSIPAHELRAAVAESDLVIMHAGVGSALMALEAGKCPVMLPRRRAHKEHVDDHQTMIANELSGRGLAVSCEADEVTVATLRVAAGRSVRAAESPAPFILQET
ncbi:MAG TPA: glycosyltransferase [Mycobacteriales bacterium]|nr:glycosyltransferase [Mycobacteriales bacterium]